ncbi:MAG: molybdate ABC transporter substrate-binding protein [Chloroflexi bacterium]|nr:molybdate ABC transporter substrate-binding protein [Chloroflexota bacterium]
MAAALLLILLAGSVTQAAQPQALIVFAAASLTDAFLAIETRFEAAHPDTDVIYNFAGSSTLAAQILQGAPADVFASANPHQMDAARAGGQIAGEPQIFAYNRLALITPADNPAGIESLRDLATPGVRLVIAGLGVPARAYTDAMFSRLASAPTYGRDYWAAVRANVVSEEENVRQVLLKVLLGEADAGIVYRSDVTPGNTDRLRALPIPRLINARAQYPIAITAGSAQPERAAQFIDYVLSEPGQTILAAWSLIPVRSLDGAAGS